MKKVIVRTPAKVNLFLDVIARETNGYHQIVTLFQAINLYDKIEISLSDTTKINVIPSEITIEHNIIEDVINKLQLEGYITENFNIVLHKQIPIGAGLGGGSADAAGTFIGIKNLLNLQIPDNKIEKILSSIGCDAPFFVKGGLQFGIHYGEMLDTIDTEFKYYVLLVYPGFRVSTEAAYKLLNESLFQKGEKRLENLISSMKEKNLDKLICNVYNIFEEVVYKEYPELGTIKQRLKAEGADNAILSGTGSVVYGIYKEKKRAEEALKKIENSYNRVILAEPVYKGVEVIEE